MIKLATDYLQDAALGSERTNFIAADDYYIQRMENGLDELHFTVQLTDPAYLSLQEEVRVIETTEEQTYVVKTIDAGSNVASIGCQLDLDDWRDGIHLGYKSGSRTAYAIVNAVKPAKWTVSGAELETKKREINMDGPTSLDIVLDAMELFGCAIRFDNFKQEATIIIPERVHQSDAYAVDSVNLRKAEFKGKSSDLYTRLYPIGKDGLSIAGVNNGLPYVVNNNYTRRTVCKLWVDERYTDPQSLKEDAQARVDAASQPVRSWELDVTDLYQLDSTTWDWLKMDMFDKILLVDPYRNQQHMVQIRQQRIYPYYPERNKIYISTAGSVQRSLKQVIKEITDRNSKFYQILNAKEGL